MKKVFLSTFIIALALAWSSDGKALNSSDVPLADREETLAQAASKKGQAWDAFEIADLLAKREQSNRSYLQFLKVPTLSAGLYVLPAGAQDRQPVHNEDEIYYVVSGRGTLKVGDEDQPVQPGSIVFVKAGIEHRFHSIKEELKVVVFFSSAKPS